MTTYAIEALETSEYRISGMEGGIRMPRDPEVVISPVEKFRP